jgi:hypothetical protein
MNRAIELVTRHLESWNTRGNDIISETMAFLFIQYDHDGSMVVNADRSELFDFAALSPFKAALVGDLFLRWRQLVGWHDGVNP